MNHKIEELETEITRLKDKLKDTERYAAAHHERDETHRAQYAHLALKLDTAQKRISALERKLKCIISDIKLFINQGNYTGEFMSSIESAEKLLEDKNEN